MKKRLLLLTLMLFVFVFFTYAHRLNEYLQATTISITQDNITLRLHLTAGSDVAQKIIKEIDVDGDGILTAAEQEAYAGLIVRSLSLNIDNQNEPLQLVSWRFPVVNDIINGTGDMQLIVIARLVPGKPVHHLTFVHLGRQPRIVYLVNCLLPADTGIRIVAQTRNADQSVYQLVFTTGNKYRAASADQLSLDESDHRGVVKTFFLHGVRHILTGYDHLLFLCALVLGAAGLWDLVKIVTAFTIAHSITLTLATYGLAYLPEQVVEPMIAASIVFVAVQNIGWPERANGNSRLVIAFFFGLFHGLGFAGGLLELMHATPANLIVFAILGFSLGVEAGNQIILLPLYGLLQLVKRSRNKNNGFFKLAIVKRYASFAVAVAGLFYLGSDLFNIIK